MKGSEVNAKMQRQKARKLQAPMEENEPLTVAEKRQKRYGERIKFARKKKKMRESTHNMKVKSVVEGSMVNEIRRRLSRKVAWARLLLS